MTSMGQALITNPGETRENHAWPAMTMEEVEATLCAPGSRFELETVVVTGAPARCWKNQHRNLVELSQAANANFHDREFLIFEDERVTYGGWFRAVARLSEHLFAAGIRKGDRIALAMRNFPEWSVAFFAGAATGAIVVPLNAWWTGRELRHGLGQSGSKMLICDAERWERLQPELAQLPVLEEIFVCRADRSGLTGATRLEDIIGTPVDYDALPDADLPAVAIDPDDDATILYTSGTTGLPKGALATHRSNLVYILGAAYSAERSALRRGEVSAPTTPPVLLSAAPFFHVTGLNACLFPLIDAGGTFVMMRKWDSAKALHLIEREKINKIGGVPTIAWELLEHPDRERHDLRSLQTVFYGGASSAPELVRRIATELEAAPSNGWGMTEVCAAGTHNSAEDYIIRPESCGPAYPGTELRIMDSSGEVTLLTGEVGELWIKGVQLIKGYWNDPEATAATIRDGWLRTGDLARLDDEGFCYIVGRAKEVVIRGGENIYPVEVENVLYQHPAVIDAAVVGIPHRTLGEEPAAAVHLAPETSVGEADLKAWVAEHIAAFKVPVKILILDRMLPRNANGKIMKSEVRQIFERC